MRLNFLAIISGSILSVLGQGAEAVGPTLACTKVGQEIVFRGYQYSCVKTSGKLVWKKGAKVVATSPTATESALIFVAKTSEIGEGQNKIIVVKPDSGASFSVAVTHNGSNFIVISAVCIHQGCIVEATKNGLVCPCHGLAYNPDTGAVTNGPAVNALKKYVSSESAGSIYIKI